jgi:ribose transport system ATP-binding protein
MTKDLDIARSELQSSERAEPALQVSNLSKTFGVARVLSNVDLEVPAGSIRALLGENGSGKSTLIKVLSGFHQPDPGGAVKVGGELLAFGSAQAAHGLGCRFVHQDLGLIPNLSVLDNLAIGGGFSSRMGTISWRESRRRSAADLQRFGIEVDLDRSVESLSPALQAGVAISRALRAESGQTVRLLVLDEPTAALPRNEVTRLHDVVRAVAAGGVGVVYVTHFLDEVFALADDLAVLRDGVLVGGGPIADFNHDSVVELMVGDEVEPVRGAVEVRRGPASGPAEGAPPALSVEKLRTGELKDVSFAVERGEVIGIAGIVGSGREEILQAIYGSVPRESGDVIVGGKRVSARGPVRSVAAGMAFLPPDRKTQSAFLEMTATENLTSATMKRFRGRLGGMRTRAEAREADKWFATMDVRPRDGVRNPLKNFSGGNQQKILLAKWLLRGPDVLLLDGPTEGVDVAARAVLHRRLLESAAEGTAIVIASNDIEELIHVCSRVLVLIRGEIGAAITIDESVGVPTIMRRMLAEAS